MNILIQACIALLTCLVAPTLAPSSPGQSELVSRGKDGKLIYKPANDAGDIVPDFSNCGYMGGGMKLPEAPVAITLDPVSGTADDTPRIQAAIDEVSKRKPDDKGLRGAVFLKAGEYRIATSLRISAGGVVLRGQGDGIDKSEPTILRGTGNKQRVLIEVVGQGTPRLDAGSLRKVADAYVPVGARSFNLENTRGLAVGERIVVRRNGNAEWIHLIRMDQIPNRPGAAPGSTKQWSPFSLEFQRTITRIDGNRITIDAPIVQAIQAQFGGGEVQRYDFPGRIRQSGVEDLRGVSDFDKGKKDAQGKRFVDEAHAWSLVRFDAAEDCWARNVAALYFGGNCVNFDRGALHCTALDCTCLDMVAIVTGGRMYCFNVNGEQNLFMRCHATDARHAFVLSSRVEGPNAFVYCASDSDGESGPHHRWSTGTLFDNVNIGKGALRVYDRAWMGSGHGWSGAQKVFWNCSADDIRSVSPPTALNFAIGCIGKSHDGNGMFESFGQHVSPASLYLKQLEDRLGKQAVDNATAGKSP